MKEKIYTIPLNDAVNSLCECAFCYLSEKTEQDLIAYTLGPSMMEPDSRIESNKIGFCANHLRLLYSAGNRLSLALMIDTHYQSVQKICDTAMRAINTGDAKKSFGFFNKDKGQYLDSLKPLEQTTCLICQKTDALTEKYLNVFFYLWDTEPDFKKRVNDGNGYCMPHLVMLLNNAPKFFKNDKLHEFINALRQQQKSGMDKVKADLGSFIDSFDYRNKPTTPDAYSDALPRALIKLRGYISK